MINRLTKENFFELLNFGQVVRKGYLEEEEEVAIYCDNASEYQNLIFLLKKFEFTLCLDYDYNECIYIKKNSNHLLRDTLTHAQNRGVRIINYSYLVSKASNRFSKSILTKDILKSGMEVVFQSETRAAYLGNIQNFYNIDDGTLETNLDEYTDELEHECLPHLSIVRIYTEDGKLIWRKPKQEELDILKIEKEIERLQFEIIKKRKALEEK